VTTLHSRHAIGIPVRHEEGGCASFRRQQARDGSCRHLLVGVYAGLVLLTTQVVRIHSTVAVAASTLVAAALFNPVRRRVQRVVDRRFNRARYDADQMVAAFAARLKDAVDLDSVRDDLTGVVHQAGGHPHRPPATDVPAFHGHVHPGELLAAQAPQIVPRGAPPQRCAAASPPGL
jgi:hypothetical protein